MNMETVISILVLFATFFGLYKFIQLIRRKKREKPLVLPEYVSSLQNALRAINTCQSVQEVKNAVGSAIRSIKKYHQVLTIAGKEREAEITKKPSKPFEKRERRIRIVWLTIFFVQYVIPILCFIGVFIFTVIIEKELGPGFWPTVVMLIIGCCAVPWSIFHCAYQKKGTALLTFILTMYILAFVGSFSQLSVYAPSFVDKVVGIAIIIVHFGSYAFLRKINREGRTRRQLAYVLSTREINIKTHP